MSNAGSWPNEEELRASADSLNDRGNLVGAIHELFGSQLATKFERVVHHALLYHAKLRNAMMLIIADSIYSILLDAAL